jgi:hypothetical protein
LKRVTCSCDDPTRRDARARACRVRPPPWERAPCCCQCQCGNSMQSSQVEQCRDPGSNRGPSDLRSDALPAELSRRCRCLSCICIIVCLLSSPFRKRRGGAPFQTKGRQRAPHGRAKARRRGNDLLGRRWAGNGQGERPAGSRPRPPLFCGEPCLRKVFKEGTGMPAARPDSCIWAGSTLLRDGPETAPALNMLLAKSYGLEYERSGAATNGTTREASRGLEARCIGFQKILQKTQLCCHDPKALSGGMAQRQRV